jgi:hypothetical protein
MFLTAKREAEPVGKYMRCPLLSLERLSLEEKEGKVCYQYGKRLKRWNGRIIWDLSP